MDSRYDVDDGFWSNVQNDVKIEQESTHTGFNDFAVMKMEERKQLCLFVVYCLGCKEEDDDGEFLFKCSKPCENRT